MTGAAMTASIFAFLESIGFTHPLHPGLTHIPMGMVIGCFIFSLLAWTTHRPELNRTAFHCCLLGLVFMVPTVLAGLLDWQHRFGAQFEALIIVKMVLAPLLTGLMGYAAWSYHKGAEPKKLFLLYALGLACAAGLGFAGGELVYGK